jgi:hypothetical protein
MNWRPLFSQYATSTGFQISLSREQIFILKKIRAYEHSEVKVVGKFSFEKFIQQGKLNTLSALLRKGFIELGDGHYQLTPVGVTVLSLIDMAGLETGKRMKEAR